MDCLLMHVISGSSYMAGSGIVGNIANLSPEIPGAVPNSTLLEITKGLMYN